MKEIKLGEKVLVKKYLSRTNKPWRHNRERDYNRYKKIDWNKECTYCGKRMIYREGYTSGGGYDESYYFVPVKRETVHLVALNKQRIAYVSDEDLEQLLGGTK